MPAKGMHRVSGYWHTVAVNRQVQQGSATSASVCTWRGDRITIMSFSVDSPSGETLNRGPLTLLLRRQYEFPLGLI